MTKVNFDKPSLASLISAIELMQSGKERMFIDGCVRDEKWASDIYRANNEALKSVNYIDYNQDGFKQLISAIENNGVDHFNMTSFISSLRTRTDEESYESESTHGHLMAITDNRTVLSNTTKTFNCDTVGCIAGFATATALNWKDAVWMKGDSRDYSHYFEAISCNFLNIPLQVGKRIWYGEAGSVWSFLKCNNEEFNLGFNNLVSMYDEDGDCEDYYDEYNEISLNSITYKDAVNCLTDIASGKILFEKLSNDDEDIDIILNPTFVSESKKAGQYNAK